MMPICGTMQERTLLFRYICEAAHPLDAKEQGCCEGQRLMRRFSAINAGAGRPDEVKICSLNRRRGGHGGRPARRRSLRQKSLR